MIKRLVLPDRPFHNFEANKSVSIKCISFPNQRISRLWNCEKPGRESNDLPFQSVQPSYSTTQRGIFTIL